LIKSPRRQDSQVPSLPPKKPTPTRCPTLHLKTLEPMASIRPTTSCPGTRGRLRPGNWPSTVNVSVPQIPQASTRIRTCPSPGSGIGLSTIRRLLGAATSTALYVFAISSSLADAICPPWMSDQRVNTVACDSPAPSLVPLSLVSVLRCLLDVQKNSLVDERWL